MRDTFADTTAARRDLGFRSTVAPRRGARARVGLDPGAGMRRRSRSSWPALLAVAACAPRRSRTSPPSPATPTRSSGRPGRRRCRRRTGSQRAPALPAASSTASRRASTAPTARLGARRHATIEEGGTGNYILAVGAYREFLTLYPSHPQERLRPVPGRRRPTSGRRTGPTATRPTTLQALEEYERLLDLYPSRRTSRRRADGSRSAARRLARAEFMAGYFYQQTRQSCRAAIARYEGILKDYPDYDDLDEVLFRMAECLHAQGRTAEALPASRAPAGGIPESASGRNGAQPHGRVVDTRRLPASGRPRAPAPAPPADSPRPRRRPRRRSRRPPA